jgi:hypothetical protein
MLFSLDGQGIKSRIFRGPLDPSKLDYHWAAMAFGARSPSFRALLQSGVVKTLNTVTRLKHGALSGFISDLQRVQNNITCLAIRALRTAGYEPISIDLQLLHVKCLIIYKTMVFAFKVRSSGKPQYLKDMILGSHWPTPFHVQQQHRCCLFLPCELNSPSPPYNMLLLPLEQFTCVL